MKKVLVLVLVLVMVMSLVACGQKDEPATDATDEAATDATDEAATDATDETATDEVATDTETSESGDKELPQGDWFIALANGYIGNTWRAQYVEAFEAKGQELVDAGYIAKYEVASTNTDVTEQLNQINSLVSDGVDAICLNPISPASVIPIIEICKENDVLLVIATDPAGVDPEIKEVLVDNSEFFEIMTKWFIEKMDGTGNIVQITGNPGMPATIVRQAVVDRLLADTDIKVLGSAPGSWSQTEAQAAMTTFLSTFDNIDGVLTEDVMAEGIIRAYETAGIEVPIMTGDYVMSFFRKWDTMPELQSVTTTFQPQASGDAISYAVRILNGWETNVEFDANPLDESIVNVINIPPSYCVTKEPITGDEAWAQGYELTQFISLAEALELGADLADTAALGTALTDEQWNAMFK